MIGKYDYANPAALKRLHLRRRAVCGRSRRTVLEACYNAAQEVYAEQ